MARRPVSDRPRAGWKRVLALGTTVNVAAALGVLRASLQQASGYVTPAARIRLVVGAAPSTLTACRDPDTGKPPASTALTCAVDGVRGTQTMSNDFWAMRTAACY